MQASGRRRSILGTALDYQCGFSTAQYTPELIGPMLCSISFLERPKRNRGLYHGVYPTRRDKDRKVTCEFVGLAGHRISQDQPEAMHVYFTGCAGNVTAGKYNDGSPAMRNILTERLYQAMVASDQTTDRDVMTSSQWRVEPVLLPSNPAFADRQSLRRVLADANLRPQDRNRIKLLHLPADIYKADMRRLIHSWAWHASYHGTSNCTLCCGLAITSSRPICINQLARTMGTEVHHSSLTVSSTTFRLLSLTMLAFLFAVTCNGMIRMPLRSIGA